MSELKLHRKLAQIMYEAERIPKNGTAPKEMGGYKFVQVGDATDYIRKALAEHTLTMMPTAVRVVGQTDRLTKSGGNMTTVDLVVTWTINDGETGESIVIESFGAGADGGDKYSGKASTSAMKYALLTGFLLSTGEDTEGFRLPEQRNASVSADVGHSDDGGLIGIVEVGDRQTSDFVLRIDRDRGPVIGFRLRGDRGGILVRAFGPLAQQLFEGQEYVIRKRVTAYGRVEDVPAEGKARAYQRLIADRVSVPGLGVLPVPDEDGPPPIAEGQEPLFSAEDQRAIDEALAGVES